MYYSWIDKHDSYKYIDTKLQTCTLLSSYSQTYSPLAEMTASQCFSNLSASRRMTSAESVDRDTSKKALSSTSFSKLVSWRRISSMGKIIRSHRLRSGEYGDWRSRRACLISKKEIVWRETWGLALSCIRIMFLHTTALLSLLIWWLEKKSMTSSRKEQYSSESTVSFLLNTFEYERPWKFTATTAICFRSIVERLAFLPLSPDPSTGTHDRKVCGHPRGRA